MDTADKKMQLQANEQQVRIGGKGTPRRKKKMVRRFKLTDAKKLMPTLQKLGAVSVPGISTVDMHKHNGDTIHFVNPKVQASTPGNLFAISGHNELKEICFHQLNENVMFA